MRNTFGFRSLIHNMANALGVQKVCIDNEKAVQSLDLQHYTTWQRNFSQYKHKYVMTKDIADKTTWEFVMDAMD
jgi:hypothetical protein